MKKSLVVFVVCLVLMVSLFAACQSDTSQSDTSSEDTATEDTTADDTTADDTTVTTLKFAMCMSHQTNDFQTTLTGAAKAKGEELGVEVVVFDGNNDSATQISQIETAVDQGYDGIMFEPINVDSVTEVVKYANQEGVPIMNVCGAMTDWEDYVAAFVGGDNVTAGEMEMQHVADLLGGEGNIAILNGPMGSDPQLQRYEGYENVLANYPDITIVFEDDAAWATDTALNIVENWLQAGKEIDAIVCQNDGMAVGAGKAVQDAGVEGIIVTGVDATSDGIDAIESGMITGTVSQDAAGQGELAVETLYKIVMGEELESNDIRTENIWIDASNVADVE